MNVDKRIEEFWVINDAIRALVKRSVDKKGSYAYAVGALQVIAADAIELLPKTKRQKFLEVIDSLNR